MFQLYPPGLLDRLLDDMPPNAVRLTAADWTLDQLKNAITRDLEALLNTRCALGADALSAYPEASRSILSYGLIDFADMCLSSDVDQKKICAAVQLTVERHETRLHDVRAALRIHPESVNRIDFVIAGRLKADPSGERVHFDAKLKPSSQQYSIRLASGQSGAGA